VRHFKPFLPFAGQTAIAGNGPTTGVRLEIKLLSTTTGSLTQALRHFPSRPDAERARGALLEDFTRSIQPSDR
jgi:hypothetical protein